MTKISLRDTPSPPPDFTVSATPGTATIKRGEAATFTLNVAPQNGFNSAVSFSCSGLPTGTSCAFTPNPVTPSSGSVSSSLKISTTAPTASLHAPLQTNPVYALWLFSSGFAVVGLCFVPRRLRSKKLLAIAGLLVLAVMIIQAGCAGGGTSFAPTPSPTPPTGGTPVGSFTVTVLATSGSMQHSTNIQLNVQ